MTIERAVARPSAASPRFHVRAERGSVRVVLAAPLSLHDFALEELQSELLLQGPLQLQGGAARFQHQAAVLEQIRFSVRAGGLADQLGIRLWNAGSTLRCELTHEGATVQADVVLRVEGDTLVFQIVTFRGFSTHAQAAVEQGLAAAGFTVAWPEARAPGGFRVVLAELFASLAWRIPDWRQGSFSVRCGERNAIEFFGGRNHESPVVAVAAQRCVVLQRFAHALSEKDGARASSLLLEFDGEIAREAQSRYLACFRTSLAQSQVWQRLVAMLRDDSRVTSWRKWQEDILLDDFELASRLTVASFAAPLALQHKLSLAEVILRESARRCRHARGQVASRNSVSNKGAQALLPASVQQLCVLSEGNRAMEPWVRCVRGDLAWHAGDRVTAQHQWRSGLENSACPSSLFGELVLRLGACLSAEEGLALLRATPPPAYDPLVEVTKAQWLLGTEAVADAHQILSEAVQQADDRLREHVAEFFRERGESEFADVYGTSIRVTDLDDDGLDDDGLDDDGLDDDGLDDDGLDDDGLDDDGLDDDGLDDDGLDDDGLDDDATNHELVLTPSLQRAQLPPEEARPVTQVSARDEDVRGLLEFVDMTSDPEAVLTAAIEEAYECGDAQSMRRVLDALERLGEFPGALRLANRARKLLQKLHGQR